VAGLPANPMAGVISP